ncbi:MAG: phosphodiesterase [Sphaerochaeta sp.]|jgi:putative phosphoesterase|nr:phosphodiesterase [Sphaerochaeta sp.]MCI2045717.1 phosphodiesterase [Sphaerochaeta sp.]MCI2096572.1 phosphodiesterase [Sphaerochaeta sp.]MCI2105004.1 phosphodiesterase [Sphaerochaeta sp.]MCI2127787.1 phosphodiesterase [Sphaerochaeta sp.]
MKLFFASDIHGSAPATERMIAAYQESGAQRMILLGDILYHGPRNDLPEGYAPKQVVSLLSPLAPKILCVRGNCEAEVDQMVLPFPVMADYAVLFVEALSPRMVYLTHGHHPLPPLCDGDVVISGHTHIPLIDQGPQVHLNPGSASLPKGGFKPSYMVYDDGLFVIKDFDGGVIGSWRAV